VVVTLAKVNSTLANCNCGWRQWGDEEGGKGTARLGFCFSTFHRIPVFSADEKVVGLFQ
jgi:hypothetical protein